MCVCSCNILVDTSSGVGSYEQDCKNPDENKIDILFIGNETLATHNLPKMFKDISCSKGMASSVFVSIAGDFDFEGHDSLPLTEELINYLEWDYVILLNSNDSMSYDLDSVNANELPMAKSLVDKIYKNYPGTQVLFLQDIGWKEGNGNVCPENNLVCDFTGHTQALVASYESLALNTGSKVVKSAQAFEYVYSDTNIQFIPSDLWQAAGVLPSVKGSYLMAALIYAEISDSTPFDAISLGGLSRSEAEYLQTIAAQIQLGI
ncbi:MAG: hypothetical protein CME62_07825 [Halobacteriovoraceae bacterium]|nr:hypothetical protein [Halobacteriovoraceae bacterium]